MKVTKYKHACLVIENEGKALVIDPGDQSTDFVVPKNVVAVVITHEHPDHLDTDKLQQIASENSDVVMLAHADVASALTLAKTQDVTNGSTVDVGPFHLEFFGEKHAQIHSSIPLVANIGVMVNDKLYYPGDSYTQPNKPVKFLALPLSGPWLKLGDAVDFLLVVNPERAFSTHDVHLSEPAIKLTDFLVPMLTKNTTIQYFRATEPFEV